MIRPPPVFPLPQEQEYLAHFAPGDGERLKAACYTTILFGTLLFGSDYLMVGAGPTLIWLLLLRLVLIGICVWLVFRLRAEVLTPDRLLTLAWIFSVVFVTVYGLILLTRPPHYYGHVVFDITAALIAPFVLPERVSIRLFLPLTLSVVSLASIVGLREPMAEIIFLAVLMTFSIVVFAGYVLGNLAYSYRRRAWLRERELTSLLIQRESWLAAKRQLLQTISHELRTPLNVISSSVSLLGDYGDQLQAADRGVIAERLRGAVRRMTDMIEQALTLAAVGNDENNANFPDYFFLPKRVDFAVWLDALVDDLRLSLLAGRPVTVSVLGIRETLPLPTQALRVICENLLGNAAKYSPEGEPIEVVCMLDKRAMTMKVRDRGEGIAADEERHIFMPFFRGEAARRYPAIPGSGLGLAIVREIVGALRGSVAIERPAGGGACFLVTLPLPEIVA